MEESDKPKTFTNVRSKLLRYLQKDGVVSDHPTIEEGMLIDSAAWFVWLRETGVLK
jgi:hypothetical protein